MLDDYTSEDLVRELHRRHYRRTGAMTCPYCNKPLMMMTTPEGYKRVVEPVRCTCKYPDVDKYHSPHVLSSLQYGD